MPALNLKMDASQLSSKNMFPKSNVAVVENTKEHSVLGRPVTRTLKIHETSEGIGSKVRRCIGNKTVRCLTPFVICEHFRMYEKGRPPHPARGAQNITYMLSGRVKIEYSPANSLILGPGDITSLMVGKGIVRSVKAVVSNGEEQKKKNIDRNPLLGSSVKKSSASGIQIYMDVPEHFKRIDPSHLILYQSDLVTCSPNDGALVKILTGSMFGKKAERMLTVTPALILDITLEPGSKVEIPVKMDWNAFAYIIKGKAHIQGENVQKHQYVEFMRSPGSQTYNNTGTENLNSNIDNIKEELIVISVDAKAIQHCRIFFCAAQPLSQPIYRQGPFVDVSMNWIHQAFDDYSERKNGFEVGQWWNNPSQMPSNGALNDSMSVASVSASQNLEELKKPSKWGLESSPSNTNNNNSCGGSDNGIYTDCQNRYQDKTDYSHLIRSGPNNISQSSDTTKFNSVETVKGVKKQQLLNRSQQSSVVARRRKHSESCESDISDETSVSISSPPPKKLGMD